MTFFVVGMPRGGTTIVAKVFNSLTDGFCLGEPHWYWQTEGHQDMYIVKEACFGKVGGDVRQDMKLTDLMGWIEKRVKLGNYHVGGYKETWFSADRMLPELIANHQKRVDFYLVVFRHPLKVHSSQWRLGWKEAKNADQIVEGYRALDKLARHHKAIPVCYEKFIGDAQAYLNARLPFQIEGLFELSPTGHRFGDPYANYCTRIEHGEGEDCLPDDLRAHHKETEKIWEHWSKS